MPNKAIKTKSKAAFQSPTSICEMNASYWKNQWSDKKEKNSKPYKKKNQANWRPAYYLGKNNHLVFR